MKRKVNRVGTSTLTVSLPSKWAKEHALRPGDELDLVEQDDALLLSKQYENKQKSITCTIAGWDYFRLSRTLAVLYRAGYDRITLLHPSAKIYYDKKGIFINVQEAIRKLVTRNLGSEIISQSDTKTVIEAFVADGKNNLDAIQRRIHFLIGELFDQLLATPDEEYATFHESVYARHDVIAKFTNYFLRELELSKVSVIEKRFLYSLYMLVDKLVDKVRYVSEKIVHYGMTKKVRSYLEDWFSLIKDYFSVIRKNDFTRDLVKKRYALLKKFRNEIFTADELQVIMEVSLFLDVINHFAETVIACTLSSEGEC